MFPSPRSASSSVRYRPPAHDPADLPAQQARKQQRDVGRVVLLGSTRGETEGVNFYRDVIHLRRNLDGVSLGRRNRLSRALVLHRLAIRDFVIVDTSPVLPVCVRMRS